MRTGNSVLAMTLGCLLWLCSVTANASVVASEYFVHVSITHPVGAPLYSIPISSGLQYSLNATIHSLTGTLAATVDIYFGVLTPEGVSQSWIKSGDNTALVKGFQPLFSGISLVGGVDSGIANIQGRDIKHQFSGTEMKGMYTVYAILAKSGTDATNPDNWVGVSMTPLFLK
jgi:hypothetical protein